MYQDNEGRVGIAEKVNKYKGDVEILIKYLPWLQQINGQKLSKSVAADENNINSLKVPVYDSTLLSFIKAAQKTSFINKNYVYTYSKYKIRNSADELKVIDRTQIMEIEVLGDILSRYVLKGMTKGVIWTDGVSDGVFLKVVSRMKELIEFWTVPM